MKHENGKGLTNESTGEGSCWNSNQHGWMSAMQFRFMKKGICIHVFLILVGIFVYFLQSFAWPLSPGRDYWTYMVYYFDFLNPLPTYHLIMLFRTPLAPLFWGGLLSGGHVLLAEIVMGFLYGIALLLVRYIAGYWGRGIAIMASILFLCCSANAWQYHTVSSEALFSFLFLAWMALVVHTYRRPASIRLFAWHGWIIFLLTMTRPVAQVYIPLFILFPFLLRELTGMQKIIRSVTFLLTIVPLLVLYSWSNLIRYDDFTVSRTGTFHLPFNRIFFEGVVHGENGPASQLLISTVNSQLLVKEPYLSRGIQEEIFFQGKPKERRGRMLYDLVGLSDRVWGWDSDYAIFRKVSIEAIVSRPVDCVRLFVLSYFRMLNVKPEYPAPKACTSHPVEEREKLSQQNSEKTVCKSESEEWIPHSYFQWTWSSPYKRSVEDLADARRKLDEKIGNTLQPIPNRDGVDGLASGLNILTVALPEMGAWLFLGLLGFCVRPNLHWGLLLFVTILTLAVPSISYLGIDDIAEFRTMFDPILMIIGLAGILGTRPCRFAVVSQQVHKNDKNPNS